MKFRPRFSLKVLMLLVAAIAIVCAYHVNWIHQRHAFLAHNSLVTSQFPPTHAMGNNWPSDFRAGWTIDQPDQLAASRIIPRKTSKHTFNFLWLFGERRREQVSVVYRSASMPERASLGAPSFGEDWALQNIPAEEIDAAERLFPEADIRYVVFWVEKK